MSKKITLEEIKTDNLRKVIAEIETIENTYERVTSRLKLIEVIHYLKDKTDVDMPEGREALNNTKKKTDNKATSTSKKAQEKAKAVKEAVEQVNQEPEVTEEAAPEITPEPKVEETVVEEPAQESVEETTEEVVQEEQVIDETPMLMDAGDGTEVDIRPFYNALNITETELDIVRQYIAFYASLYDLSEIVSAYSQGISSDLYELINDDNAAAFYEYLTQCMQG